MLEKRLERLTSKFMTSQPGLQSIAILSNISQSKNNQTIKFGQLIEHNKRNTFFKNYAKNEVGRVVPDVFLFFKKLNTRWKQVVCSLVSIDFDSPHLLYSKSKLHNILDYWFKIMFIFHFSEKSLGLVSRPHFVCDFSRKMFLMLHSTNWPNSVESVSDCLYFSRYWAICILK